MCTNVEPLHVNVATSAVHENGIVQEIGAKLGQYECIFQTKVIGYQLGNYLHLKYILLNGEEI